MEYFQELQEQVKKLEDQGKKEQRQNQQYVQSEYVQEFAHRSARRYAALYSASRLAVKAFPPSPQPGRQEPFAELSEIRLG